MSLRGWPFESARRDLKPPSFWRELAQVLFEGFAIGFILGCAIYIVGTLI